MNKIRERVEVYANVLADNDSLAANIRADLLSAGTILVNVMGTPGAGKTSVIKALARLLPTQTGRPCAVIEGDLESSIDTDELIACGIPAVQINTHGMCHLDAVQIGDALPRLAPGSSIVFIENVGNLICPVSYRLGESLRLLVVSTTEGSDKPHKYPPIFETADIVVVNKSDLEAAMEFDRGFFEAGVRRVNRCPILYSDARKGGGIEELASWIGERYRESLATAENERIR